MAWFQGKSRGVRLALPLLAVALVGAIGSYLLSVSHAAPARPAGPPASLLQPHSLGLAPYQYIAYDGSLDETLQATGVTQIMAAFIISQNGACTPAWGGGALTGLDSPRAGAIAADIDQLRRDGGEITVSFGGSGGTELASACTSAAQLAGAYQSVISRYSLRQVDFDIEGAALADSAASQRRADALASLQRQRPSLKVWLTLPVHNSGLTASGLSLIGDLQHRGVVLSGINVLAMNYNIGSKNMGAQAVKVANATFDQLRRLYPNNPPQAIWRAMGITVMAGQNNTVPETFTLANAAQVRTYALKQGIGLLSLWNVNRDQPCTSAAVPGSPPSSDCSGVAQAPYAFLRALAIPAAAGQPSSNH